jgi:hypothetical protein
MRHRIQQRINANADANDANAVPGAAPAATTATAATAALTTTAADGNGDAPVEVTEPVAASAPAVPVPDSSVLSYASNLVVDQADLCIDFIRPLRAGSTDAKAHMEYFKRQLELVETVDEAIEEIDTGYYREKRDV